MTGPIRGRMPLWPSVVVIVVVLGWLGWVGSGHLGQPGDRTAAPLVVAPLPPVTMPENLGVPESTPLPEATPSTASVVTSPVDPGWLSDMASSTGIPDMALDAYAAAALVVGEESPGCGIGWNTLAAIGYIESAHASHEGARLLESGYSEPRILGVPLNGSGVAAISDTDGGSWDGDTVWDRAVGPMQFIPSTWATWAADADGDGAADPNQIQDAALGAARYLCHSGEMSSVSGWRAAVFSYNHSESYVDQIAATANEYAGRVR